MRKSINCNLEVVFGNNVRTARLRKDLSQEELAFRSGLHRNYLSDVERGTRNVSIKAMSKIADGLEIEVYKLLQK